MANAFAFLAAIFLLFKEYPDFVIARWLHCEVTKARALPVSDQSRTAPADTTFSPPTFRPSAGREISQE